MSLLAFRYGPDTQRYEVSAKVLLRNPEDTFHNNFSLSGSVGADESKGFFF